MLKFRELRADEIEARVQSVKEKGLVLLLYKNARVDMEMLDETVGCMNWERKHEIIDGRLYCTVSIYDERTNRWVSKQDVGTESNTEKEKGQASDSFKRACFNWGIGRELYSSPFIWIGSDKVSIKGGKCFEKFEVSEIGYDENKKINKLIVVDSKGKVVYSFSKQAKTKATPKAKPVVAKKELTMEDVFKIGNQAGFTPTVIVNMINKKFSKTPDELTAEEIEVVYNGLKSKIK